MDDDKARLNFQRDRFAAALTALQDAVASDTGDKKSRDSILLSYVFTFEMSWKALKAALAVLGETAPNDAAGTFKAAFTAGLVTDPDLWMDLREARNEVSHAYDLDKAIAIAALVTQRAVAAFQGLMEGLRHVEA